MDDSNPVGVVNRLRCRGRLSDWDYENIYRPLVAALLALHQVNYVRCEADQVKVLTLFGRLAMLVRQREIEMARYFASMLGTRTKGNASSQSKDKTATDTTNEDEGEDDKGVPAIIALRSPKDDESTLQHQTKPALDIVDDDWVDVQDGKGTPRSRANRETEDKKRFGNVVKSFSGLD